MKTNFFAAAAFAMMAAACTSGNNASTNNETPAAAEQTAPAATATSIVGMQFTIVELNGTELKSCSEEEAASIAFEADKVNAYVGCNRIFATPSYGENGHHIALEMGGATRMACPDGCREDEFLEAFNKLDSYELTEAGADFKDCSGAVVFRGKKN